MADVDHLVELFAPLKGVSFKRMFSGYGIMKDGMMFALISRDLLYFKADDELAARFRAEGSAQWTPTMRGKVMAMPYWQVPEPLFDEPDEFAERALAAFAVTKRLRAEKPKRAKSAAHKPARARRPAAKKKPTAKAGRQTKAAPKRR